MLRWNWRVGFYVYAALGTDRYPPFTLARTDYPAEFDVAYPEHLSRGLVLVKWLLAVPHLLIVGLIVADLLPYPWTSHDWSSGFQPIGGYSVLNLLVVVAGFFLLITRQYPRGLFDLLVGISRWLYRVLAFVALMRDEYPPFRLDQGEYEPSESGSALHPARSTPRPSGSPNPLPERGDPSRYSTSPACGSTNVSGSAW